MSSQPGSRAGGDTDLLLVLLETSLPDGLVVKREELLEALVLADGDVQKAAEALTEAWTRSVASTLNSATAGAGSGALTKDTVGSKPRSKRKAETGLDGWVKNARPRVVSGADSDVGQSSSSKRQRGRDARLFQLSGDSDILAGSSTLSESKPRSKPEGTPPPPLMNFLRDKSPVKSSSTTSTSSARLPPLILMTPEMVSLHTPTTLHPSVLPAGQLSCLSMLHPIWN